MKVIIFIYILDLYAFCSRMPTHDHSLYLYLGMYLWLILIYSIVKILSMYINILIIAYIFTIGFEKLIFKLNLVIETVYYLGGAGVFQVVLRRLGSKDGGEVGREIPLVIHGQTSSIQGPRMLN